MSAMVAVALATSLASALWRHRAKAGDLGLDAVVLTTATWLVGVGIAATLWALVGSFGAPTMSATAIVAAALTWPRGRPCPPRAADRGTATRWVIPIVVLLSGMALRWPVMDYPLAGRDQGTYTLRAQHTLRTGRLDATDPVLAAASPQVGTRSGPADLQGLYHRADEPWRQDRYEGSYRPGFYLADLDAGHVRAQFLHVHPMLMATAGLVLGPDHVAGVVVVYSALSLLALLAVARRLWPRGGWAPLAALLWACAPLSIWVLRTPLTEGLASVLMLGATLAVLRARDGTAGSLQTAAWLLGGLCWVRGNGWLAAPIVLAALWLVPRDHADGRRAGRWLAITFGAAVAVHAPTTFPYLHDELLRQLPLPIPPSPEGLVLITAAGLGGWWALDAMRRRREARWHGAVLRAAPVVVVLLLLAALVSYLALRPEPLARPFARLDAIGPLVGWPVLGLAAVGLGTTLRRWPRRPGAAPASMLGLAMVLVATVGLYVPRNLPRLDLYYYGRYLVPELLPALLLLAVAGLASIHAGLRGRTPGPWRARGTTALAVLASLGLGWSVSGVLVQHPVTRLPEFRGADRVVDHLAQQLPPGAVVIAGGEGWHFGHTFNQVGGALAFRHGVTVLPYHTKEAAYASLTELLQGQPAATGEPPPPVFLLLNEATKHRMRDPKLPTKVRVSAIDDLLPPPFVARRVDLVEMFLDRLSPVHDGPPTRVTRDGLRMALLRVEVDPAALARVESWTITARAGAWPSEGSPGPKLSGGEPREDHPCLGATPLTLDLPASGNAGPGPVSLVLVAAPGTAATNHAWTVEVDGHPLNLSPPRRTPRHRDTLGPIALTDRPARVVIRGATSPTPDARCPHGGLAEMRLLEPDRPMLGTAQTTATTFAPADPLGHPVTAVGWVSGRGLSRFRRGVEPTPEVRGLSLVLEPGVPLRFAAAALPDRHAPLELVVTLTGAQLAPSARLVVTVGDQPLPPIDPPDERRGSWQSPALVLQPNAAAADIILELRDAEPEDHVLLRDIGLFSRADPIAGRLVLGSGGILPP